MSRTTETIDEAVKMRLLLLSTGSLWQCKKSVTYRQYDENGLRLGGRKNRCTLLVGAVIMILEVEHRPKTYLAWNPDKPWFDITFLTADRIYTACKVDLTDFTQTFNCLKDSTTL